jgi:hypothetical protein
LPAQTPYSEFGSGYPLNVYLLIIIPILLLGLGLLKESDLMVVMMNLPIGMLIYYILFARFSCRIEINDANEMEIVYFFPWDDNLLISLDDFEKLSVERGKNSSFYLLRFSSTEEFSETIDVKVNTRSGAIPQMLTYLENVNQLKISRSAGKTFY